MQKERKIHSYALNSGTGSQTLTSLMDPLDYSGFSSLTVRSSLVATDTDAIDTCVIRLQTSADPVTGIWNDRICLESFTGDMSASSTAPETKQATVFNSDVLASVEREFEESGSLGGASLAAGAVQNGAFFPSIYNPATDARMATCRLRIAITDADSDASFIGTIDVWGLTHC